MRHLVYEILGIALIVVGVAFFYACVEFLAEKDYIAGIVVVVLGFGVLRTGVELSKLSVLLRREDRE